MMKTPIFACAFAFLLAASAQAAVPDMTANRHVQKGMPCATCHGADNSVSYPTIAECKNCHDPKDVAEATKDAKPRNPHVSPHYGNELDCVLCHVQHGETENYCDQCHTFGFKVP